MDFKKQSIGDIKVIGVYRHFKSRGHAQSNIPDFWEDVHNMKLDQRLLEKSNHIFHGLLGICIPQEDSTMNYAIAVTSDDKPHDGLETFNIDAGNYMVVEALGPVPQSVQQTMKQVHSKLMNNSEIHFKNGPFFEVYSEENMQSKDYVTEIWLPVD